MNAPPNMSPTIAARAHAIALAVEFHTVTIERTTTVNATSDEVLVTAKLFLSFMRGER